MNLSDQIRDLVRGIEIQMEELKKALVDECGKTLRLESQLEEAETLITQTSHGAAERIAELEAQIAAKADTDKLREAVEAMNRAKLLPIWDNDVPHKLHVELDVIFKALSSMAAQAPVREVPEDMMLVPKTPTKEQRSILEEAAPRWNAESIYANLLDAALTEPKP